MAMKFLTVLVASIAYCAASPISLVPGDNSHYVEGESRYIWMPDGNGVPQLVDLQEREELNEITRDGADNQYWLFTRENPTVPNVLYYGHYESLVAAKFDRNRPLKVIVHGWNSDGTSKINPLLTEAFLQVSNCNVIVVDWHRLANRIYWTAVRGVPDVGTHLGNFLQWLIDTTGGDWNKVHLVGFSLGAHIVGNAGRTVGSKPARITGLDPAGPNWGGNSNALKADDAQYVEAIHTAGGTLGIFDPIGRTNFYPNGGRNSQPGCLISTCSHSRAYEFFASSIYSNHFVAKECNTLNEARRGRCRGNRSLNMGNAELAKHGDGLYGLSTRRNWPF